MPFDQVRKGMHGYGLTVFQGNKVEKFDVEIIGVLNNIGPDQNLILAHVDSQVIKSSGVIAGMSGSPIYVDGKVIGALAYSWQFAKDSIAGITPIEEMLALSSKKTSSVAIAPQIPASTMLKALTTREFEAPFQQIAAAAFNRRPAVSGSALPIATPLSMSSFSASTIARFSPMLENAGFLAVPSGTMSAAANTIITPTSTESFSPGDAVAAVLISGDFNIAATGTVTEVDGKKVYGFGHPFLDMGSVDFPMAKAEVVGVLPSLANSFKFANTGAIVGAFHQDRNAGILGITGAKSEMIPVEMSVDDGDAPRTYRFNIVHNAQLFPLLLAMASDNVVNSSQRAAGERTVVLDTEIMVEGYPSLKIRDGWAGSQAKQAIPAYLAVLSNYLLANEFTQAKISGVKLHVRHDDDLRVAKILEASLDTPLKGEYHPGDTVRVNALLKPFRGNEFRETFDVKIPEVQKPGTSYLMIGSGSLANQLGFMIVPPDPRSLDQLLGVIRRLRSSTDLTVSLFTETAGMVSGGAYQPNLPPSVTAVLGADSSNGNEAPVRYDPAQQLSKPLDYIIDGAVRLDLVVTPRV
jgi:hypothetical protein